LVWEEDEGTVCCHAFCEAVHEWLCLDVEVTKHGIRAPAAKELDFVFVDIGAQKSHGSTSAEAAGFDVFCGKPREASPRTRTAARRAFVMCAGRTRSHWVV